MQFVKIITTADNAIRTPVRNFPTTITIVSVRMGRIASTESF